MRTSPAWFIFAGLMLLLDFYVFGIVKMLSQHLQPKTKTVVFSIYWVISVLAVVILFILPLLNLDGISKGLQSAVFAIIIGLFLAKLISSIFFLIDDIRRGMQWLAGKTLFRNTEAEQIHEQSRISRSLFLSWAGMAAGGGLFTSLIYGLSNKYNYRIKRVPLQFPALPAAFKGLRIVQLSDIHSGSFTNKAAVRKGVDMVLALKPDLILFTGDLVNNTADEMVNYIDVFNRLKAPLGVYSTLGNHDYGDYVQWPDAAAKAANLQRLKEIHAQLGWRLLMNEHVAIERGGEAFALIGIENWGAKARFPKYGKMSEAYPGAERYSFKLLMSHDPSHWDAEIRKKYPDIDLMLSGHTHGMQFGLELPWLKWSPVEYVYRQWAGLYQSGRQQLYVNRGFGFIGYPGRVGILPEITLLELNA